MKYDKVTLVDENDLFLGEMDKTEAHRGDGFLHRASSVYLFRRNKQSDQIELLIQQRSELKIVGGLEWGNTICGNVWPIENYTKCAVRRLADELGILVGKSIKILDVYNFIYHVRCNNEYSERELDHVFWALTSEELQISPNPLEVSNFLWVGWYDLLNQVKKSSFDRFHAGSETIEVISENRVYNVVFSPWTMLMLSDQKLCLKFEEQFKQIKNL